MGCTYDVGQRDRLAGRQVCRGPLLRYGLEELRREIPRLGAAPHQLGHLRVLEARQLGLALHSTGQGAQQTEQMGATDQTDNSDSRRAYSRDLSPGKFLRR
eukprot:scaffold91417_cov29-Prasinocladus_malaysianus.AAC.1